MIWPARLAIAKGRPFNAQAAIRTSIIATAFVLFLYGDYSLFRRMFLAVAQVEATTPFFAIGLLRNFAAMIFLVATIVLFSSALTAAIGAFFTDLDLDLYHAAPRSKTRVLLARWGKTLAQSATIVYVFLVPLFVAFAGQYHATARFHVIVLVNLLLLLTIPVSAASLLIILLVRYFPVRRVHQIVATIAILIFTVAVVAFRVSRPERFFTAIDTPDVANALRGIELPSMERYPSTALADIVSLSAAGGSPRPLPWKIALPALGLFAAFVLVGRRAYFPAYVRAKESMAPMAIGATQATRLFDRLIAGLDPPTRAMIFKEVRTLSRDVAQWSQLFLMAALLFLYLYNIRMLPLGGDVRATIVAYANLGMAGFVVAGICLRFAYPSISSEGKAFWLLQGAPISYRRLLWVKVIVYATPLTILSLILTIFADVILGADRVVWCFTLAGASLLAATLVSLGVGLGALSPNFGAENPLQVGLSLGGFAYMAVALAYVGTIMTLMARPIMQYVFWRGFGVEIERSWVSIVVPVVTAVTVSIALSVFPLLVAEKRLARIGDD